MKLRLTQRRFVILVSFAISFLILWLSILKPWQSELSISTDFEAFVGPHPGTQTIQEKDGRVMLSLGITPAPWPKETGDIWAAAKLGKIVHVSIAEGRSILHFDISGVALTGEVLIYCESKQEAIRILNALKIRYT
jgi:hypothetical protein